MSNLICLNEIKGVGVPCSQVMPLTEIAGIILARPGFTFTNAEACDTLTEWLAAVANKDLLVINNVREVEDQKVEDGVYTTAFGDKIHNWEGKQGKRLLITASKEQHEILRTYSNRNWELFIKDRNNNIWAILNADDTIQGIKLDYFHVFNQTSPTAERPAMTPIEYQHADPGEWDANGCYFNPAFRISNIVPVTHVNITVSTVAANVFTLTAAYVPDKQFNANGTAISIPLEGLEKTDLEVIDQTGAANVLVSAVEDTETKGTYVVTGATLTSGTARVKPNATSLYESDVATLTQAS